MKLFVLVLCIGAVSTIEREVPEHTASRENEPDPREFRPFKMPAVIKHVCESMRWFLDGVTNDETRPRNALQLSQLFVTEFDKNGDKCISGTEIRDIAARFRGILTGYRTIFEHVLDEDQSGCVEAEELNSLVLDCIMPSATWMRGLPDTERYSLPFKREEIARILEEPEPVDDVLVQEVDPVVAELSKEEQDTADRRQILEEEKAAITGTQLNSAVKEMICSVIRREHEDTEFGLKSLAEIVNIDGNEGLSYNEVYEFLAGSRIPREESNDLAGLMDVDKDGMVTVEELMTAVDHCPIPEVITVPVVNSRPRTNFEEVECPSQAAQYKEMRTRVMKFIGSRQIKFEEAEQAAVEFYISITGDVEKVIEPKDLDIPIDCVKDAWQNIDSDKNGFLDLFEFNRIALDVFEEFLPKPVKNTNPLRNARIEVKEDIPQEVMETVPREELDTLAELVQRVCREAGVRLPEGDIERVIAIILQDAGVAALLDKVQSTGLVTHEAEDALNSLVRPIIYKLFSE